MHEKYKEKILPLLSKHIEGLTLGEIAKSIGISRVTTSNVLNVMVTEGTVKRLEKGNVKLHYLVSKDDQKG